MERLVSSSLVKHWGIVHCRSCIPSLDSDNQYSGTSVASPPDTTHNLGTKTKSSIKTQTTAELHRKERLLFGAASSVSYDFGGS